MKNVICYINQFFAGIGGEDKADYEPEIRDGVMGPTAAINQMLAEIDAQVTTTIICGDNFMSTHRDEAIERILTALEGREFDLFLAQKDAVRFSGKLEELMVREFHFTIEIMISQGIHEAETLLVSGI